MSAVTAPGRAEMLRYLADVRRRHSEALAHEGHLIGIRLLRNSVADVPHLLAIAERGVLDAETLRAHAGHMQRADMVRELHECDLMTGGRMVCLHCTTPFRPVGWPCPTLRLLDGEA